MHALLTLSGGRMPGAILEIRKGGTWKTDRKKDVRRVKENHDMEKTE